MAVQISYPGVYIDEFAPGAPIEGVGTSTAAFIGTAARGPIDTPTLIQSVDAFQAVFGGVIADGPPSYLASAVTGFFLNGGTACYVVRVSTARQAAATLDSRQGGASPNPVLVARAIEEGPAGDAISVQVLSGNESSRLAAMLTQALAPRAITAVGGTPARTVITVPSNQGFAGGEIVVVSKPGETSQTVTVKSTQDSDKLVLAQAIPGTANFVGGAVAPAGTLAIRYAQTDIVGVSADTTTLTVADNAAFAPGDRVSLQKTGVTTAVAVVKSRQDSDKLVLTAPLAAAATFAGGTVRIADLTAGQRTLRVAVPPGLRLSLALPRGAAVMLGTTPTQIRIVDTADGDTVTLRDGIAGTASMASQATVPTVASLEFTLVVQDTATGKNETFGQLAMNREHPNYWGSAVASTFITLEEPATPPQPMPDDARPVARTYALTDGRADDRAAAIATLRANPNPCLDLLKPYDDVALVSVPGEWDTAVQQAVIAHCESMRDRFGILDSKPGVSPGNGIRDQFANVRSDLGFAALYYPWMIGRNPLTGKDELLPPSGHIAGIYARSDAQQGVHKAPANANIRGALGLEQLLTDDQQGPLNLMGINVLRVFAGQAQPLVWGARTTATDRNWQYVNVRRLFLFLEESIQEGIRWAVFQPNNLQLWQKLKRTITEFLTRVWRDGALFGKTAEEAFYVRIDEVLNPASTQALGRLYIEIGVRPTYPAEFIIVRIGIWQGGSDVTEK